MSDSRYAGMDWASEEHVVCVVDERGRIVEGRRYRHNAPGIRALCARLLRLRVALVALEVLGQREQAVVLRGPDGAQLARPLVDVAEDLAVRCPEVREVVPAVQARSLELRDPDRRLLGLDPLELRRVTDAQPVAQAARAG